MVVLFSIVVIGAGGESGLSYVTSSIDGSGRSCTGNGGSVEVTCISGGGGTVVVVVPFVK